MWTQCVFRCPSAGCGNPRQILWRHFSCGGVILIDEYADLICNRCGNSGNIYEWRFDCGGHPAKDSWRKADMATMLAILSSSVDYQNRMGIKWLMRLINNLQVF